MSSADSYSPENYDWVDADSLADLTAQTPALVAEKYEHDMVAFRRQFYGKLLAHKAMEANNFGWAIFSPMDLAGSVATLGERNTLLVCRYPGNPGDDDLYAVPALRIITNELMVSDTDDIFYTTEDIIVDKKGDARYMMDAVAAPDFRDATTADKSCLELRKSLSPLFFIDDQATLSVTKNTRSTIPIFIVTDPEHTQKRVTPFGRTDSLEDKIFALEKANKILRGVLDQDPTYSLQT